MKGSSEGSLQQSFNEIFAAKLHQAQGFKNFVPYSLCVLPNKRIGCKSKCFKSERYEFISAWDIIGSSNLSSTAPLKDMFYEKCKEFGLNLEDVQQFFDYMNLTDFLISNVDRHLNNFCLIRDSETFEYVGMAPIFDNGNSMAYIDPWDTNINKMLKHKIKGFNSSLKGMMGKIKDIKAVDISKFPGIDDLIKIYEESELSEKSIRKVSKL